MTIQPEIKALIFDFGNVIIDIDFDKTFAKFRDLLDTDYDVVMNQWEEHNFHRAIETKKMTADEMTKKLNSFGASLTDEQTREAWNALLLELPYKRIQLLRKLAGEYTLYLLSNTNYVHIETIFSDLENQFGYNPLKPLFRKLFLSYEIGFVKPEAGIYEAVIHQIPYEPNECLFFDDLQENLDGAAKYGIATQIVTKQQGILELLGTDY